MQPLEWDTACGTSLCKNVRALLEQWHLLFFYFFMFYFHGFCHRLYSLWRRCTHQNNCWDPKMWWRCWTKYINRTKEAMIWAVVNKQPAKFFWKRKQRRTVKLLPKLFVRNINYSLQTKFLVVLFFKPSAQTTPFLWKLFKSIRIWCRQGRLGKRGQCITQHLT